MGCLFGPVPSRRLALSLGVDLVPYKVCSFNCIYCEVGETNHLTVERREYLPIDQVKGELEEFFSSGTHADHITFSGFGEPTLHSGLGELARWIKGRTTTPVALLTNASLFWIPQVRREAAEVDVVLPSLDAVSEETFRKVNRPHPLLSAEKVVEGLVEFSREFTGKLWLEILLVKGINDSEEELCRLAQVVERIAPHKIQLNTVVRPPAVAGTSPLNHRELQEIAAFLPGEVEVVGGATEHSSGGVGALNETIVETVKRRPCTMEDLVKVTGHPPHEVKTAVKGLILSGRLRGREQGGEVFYSHL